MKYTSSLAVAFASSFAIALVACSGDKGAQGEPGPAATGASGTDGGTNGGTNGDPSVSAVFPTNAFLARKLSVAISGNGTKWADGTTVDFGKGIKVTDIVVASPTAIIATLTVSDSAEVGLRDVTVTAGATASVYKGAFDVESPVDLQVEGLNAQGSVFLVRLADKDPATPFDTTSQTSQFGSTTYLGIELPQVAGFKFQVQNVTATTVDFVAFVDVKAETTPHPFTFLSGVQGSAQTPFPFPKGLAITARTPEVLTLGTAKDAAIAKPLETSLYEVTPAAALGFTDLAVTTTDKTLNPRAFVLGKSGAFAEQVAPLGASTLLITSSADPLYAIVMDLAGKTGAFAVKATHTVATAATEAANHGAQATAQNLAVLPAIVTDAALSSGAEEDWYKITFAAGDVGKKLRVMTAPGDKKTDTVVTVTGPNGVFVDKVDNDFQENVLSDAIPVAGVYYVTISNSDPAKWLATASKYQLALRVE